MITFDYKTVKEMHNRFEKQCPSCKIKNVQWDDNIKRYTCGICGCMFSKLRSFEEMYGANL